MGPEGLLRGTGDEDSKLRRGKPEEEEQGHNMATSLDVVEGAPRGAGEHVGIVSSRGWSCQLTPFISKGLRRGASPAPPSHPTERQVAASGSSSACETTTRVDRDES